jgi:hypothetical protein
LPPERLAAGGRVAGRHDAPRDGAGVRHGGDVASLRLVRRVWPGIEAVEPQVQQAGGSYHRLNELSSLGLDASELRVLDKLRARSFPPYGLEFERDGQRYRARVEIERID